MRINHIYPEKRCLFGVLVTILKGIKPYFNAYKVRDEFRIRTNESLSFTMEYVQAQRSYSSTKTKSGIVDFESLF